MKNTKMGNLLVSGKKAALICLLAMMPLVPVKANDKPVNEQSQTTLILKEFGKNIAEYLSIVGIMWLIGLGEEPGFIEKMSRLRNQRKYKTR